MTCRFVVAVVVSLVLPHSTIAQTCSTQDFSITYNGAPVFTVSQANNTCYCPNYATTGPVGSAGLAVAAGQTVDVGRGSPSRQADAGKIGYGFYSGVGLDIIGGGGSIGSRQVNIYDNLNVTGSATFTLGATFRGGATIAPSRSITFGDGTQQTTAFIPQSCPANQFVTGVGAGGTAACSPTLGPGYGLTLMTTPTITERQWTNCASFTFGVTGVVAGAAAVLADVFFTAAGNDHMTAVFGNGCLNHPTNWVNGRGANPTSNFGNVALRCTVLMYHGETDGYTSTFGIWYGSQILPLRSDGQIDFSVPGCNTGDNGWFYLVVRGYYQLPTTTSLSLNLLTTPVTYAYSFTSSTANAFQIPGIATGTTAIQADVFTTIGVTDHMNIGLGYNCQSLQTTWIGTRGTQPSAAFGNLYRPCVLNTYNGDSDGFTSNFGYWYGSQTIPVRSDGYVEFNSNGNNGNLQHLYFVVTGMWQAPLISSAGPRLNFFPTPQTYQLSFTSVTALTFQLPGVSAGMKAVLANVFVTASISDAMNIALGNGCTGNVQSWVNTRGQNPTTVFTAGSAMQRSCVLLNYAGETDGFSPFFGEWYGSKIIPLRSDGQVDFINSGCNPGTTGFVYFVVTGYFV